MLLPGKITANLPVSNIWFLAHNSVGQRSRHSVPGFSSQHLTMLKSRYQPDSLSSHLWIKVLSQALWGCSKNSVPCSWRTEVPIASPAVSWDYPQLLGATLSSLPHASIFQLAVKNPPHVKSLWSLKSFSLGWGQSLCKGLILLA